jgi:hypothetical protein
VDIVAIFNVLRRFRVPVLAGTALAIALALLSYYRLSLDGGLALTHRSNETWASYSQLLVTQPGFSWGSTDGRGGAVGNVPRQSVDEGRLTTLATVYSRLVTSDGVRTIMRANGAPIRGVVDASPLQASRNSDVLLPIVNVSALATTRVDSLRLADRAARALRTYLEQTQRQNGIPARERVQLQTIRQAGLSELVSPRPKTPPIIVFFTVMAATLGLAFVLDNLRPLPTSTKAKDSERQTVMLPDVQRRTAS